MRFDTISAVVADPLARERVIREGVRSAALSSETGAAGRARF